MDSITLKYNTEIQHIFFTARIQHEQFYTTQAIQHIIQHEYNTKNTTWGVNTTQNNTTQKLCLLLFVSLDMPSVYFSR